MGGGGRPPPPPPPPPRLPPPPRGGEAGGGKRGSIVRPVDVALQTGCVVVGRGVCGGGDAGRGGVCWLLGWGGLGLGSPRKGGTGCRRGEVGWRWIRSTGGGGRRMWSLS